MPMTEHTDVTIDLGVLIAERAEEYHAKADRFLTSHQLLDFIKCPYLHRKKALGLIEDKESPACRPASTPTATVTPG